MKCFYHSADLDGHCSGAIVKYKYPGCKLIGINYGDEFPWDIVTLGEKVFMVDFSLQPFDLMRQLDEIVELTWIDHHKSAREDYNDSPLKSTTVILVDTAAACELTWEYLFDTPIPQSVHLLGRYDVWDLSNPKTLPFQYGMKLEAGHPNNIRFWADIFKDFPDEILDKGYTILDYIKQDNMKYIDACGFETDLDGLHCIAANKQLTNSQAFDTVWDPRKYHAMLAFGWRGGQWHVSLYSTRDDVDVSTIAKARGGGGHKGAAGFQCDTLPFELK